MMSKALRVGLGLVVVLGLPVRSTAILPSGLVRGPYLQLSTSTSVVVRWRTQIPNETHLSYGGAPGLLSMSVLDPNLTTEHEVEISGLDPQTVYFYSVGSEAGTIAGGDPNHFFVTSPVSGTEAPVRIWILGDSGAHGITFSALAEDVRDAYLTHAGSDIADVVIMLGDNAYNEGTDQQYTDLLFERYPEVLRNTVLWPAPGNHEVFYGESDSATQSGVYYDAFTLPGNGEAGGVPSQTEAYYSYDFGSVHFISIDSAGSSRAVGGDVYNWLESDLQSNDRDWTIVYMHHPPYTRGSYDSDFVSGLKQIRENFLPLLENYGVDIVIAGHSHVYERSMLIDGHYGLSTEFDAGLHAKDTGDGDPAGDGAYQKPSGGPVPHQGAVYITMGVSSIPKDGPLDHPVMKRAFGLIAGSMLIDVSGLVLDGLFIDQTGVVLDHFQIRKRISPPVPILVPPLTLGLLILTLLLSKLLPRGLRRR